MNLWIRSQDKRILTPITSYIIEINNSLYHLGMPLADYKTKERALEVLDEIQKLLEPKIKVIHNKIEQEKLQDFTSNIIIQPIIEDIQVHQAKCYVYEMPKE